MSRRSSKIQAQTSRGSHPDSSLERRLIAEHWGVEGGVLCIEGCPLPDLMTQFGSPLYVYSAKTMRQQLKLLRDHIGHEFDVYFSVKANPNPAVLEVFCDEGSGLEIASAGEYIRAVRAGVSTDRILFAGPGKTDEELCYVIERGVGEIHVESFDEIARLDRISRRLKKEVAVSARVNPDISVQGGAMRMGGGATPFGFDESILDEAISQFGSARFLSLKGLHIFSGTQILKVETLLDQWNYGVSLARRLLEGGVPIETLDLGGGLGIPYFRNDQPLDLRSLASGARVLLERMREDPYLKSLKLVIEPGRFLAGPSGLFATRVTTVKASRGENFTVTDGGMHHHLAASGNLGQVIKRDYPVIVANRLNEVCDTEQKIVGPLCTPLDTYGRKTVLPSPQVGDMIAILQSGAYGLSSSPVGFLSHPMPAEVLVDGTDVRLIRPRGTFEQPISPLP
ncbi:hypothetical protein [Henriciella sp.]|uniref:hypothetical protein n=1 Tax=Henriciella sp. TaxID=1968823 RepID=UPI0026046C1F|nr:hypothetical protein [Henriciella sp.]